MPQRFFNEIYHDDVLVMQMTASSKHETPPQGFRKYSSVSPTVNANLSQEIRVMAGGRSKTQGPNSWQPRVPPCKCTQDLILLSQNQWDAQEVELEHVHNHRLSQCNCYFVFKIHIFGLWLQWFSIVNVSHSFLCPPPQFWICLCRRKGELWWEWGQKACAARRAPHCHMSHSTTHLMQGGTGSPVSSFDQNKCIAFTNSS